jgi:catechol 2,3-dioxygenase-like lactoylglutathione lyase family enzyme
MAIQVRGLAPLLGVYDMPSSIRFYRDVLGFEVVATSAPGDDFGWALLSLDGTEVMLNTAYDDGRPPEPDAARIATHRDMTMYFGCPDVDGAYEHLRARGVDARPPEVAYYGMKQLYVRDPDGFGLCFQWPEDEAQRESWRERYGFDATREAEAARAG